MQYTGTPPAYQVVKFRNIRGKSNFAQVRIECTCGQLYTVIEGSKYISILSSHTHTHTHTHTHWILIGRITASPSELSPNNIIPPPVSQCVFISSRKKSAPFSKMLFRVFFRTFLIPPNCEMVLTREHLSLQYQ